MRSINRRDFVKASGLALAGAGMGVPRFGAQAAQESRDLPKHPNVLLIMTDQQSADDLNCRMGKVGGNYLHTPNMGHNGIDDDMLEPAKDFLEKQQNEDSPFFLVASYNNPHNICEWARGDRGEDLPDGAVDDPDLVDCPPLRTNHLPPEDEPRIMSFMRRSYSATGMSPVYDHTEADWRKHQWGYYKMTEIVDRHIGDLLQALRDSGQEENTLVVFLSDHGEMQGAHEWNQKWVFYDESIRVPLVFHWPGVITPGTRYQLVHTGVDLIPTLCGLTGVKRPPDLPGTDLTETIMQDKPKGRDFLVCSNYLEAGAEVGGVRRTPSGRMVRGERFKYCVYDTGEASEELYDMVNDPGEMKNLAHNSDYEDVVRQYRGYLEEFRQKYNDDEFQPFYETS